MEVEGVSEEIEVVLGVEGCGPLFEAAEVTGCVFDEVRVKSGTETVTFGVETGAGRGEEDADEDVDDADADEDADAGADEVEEVEIDATVKMQH